MTEKELCDVLGIVSTLYFNVPFDYEPILKTAKNRGLIEQTALEKWNEKWLNVDSGLEIIAAFKDAANAMRDELLERIRELENKI
jgi:hypothetical protein